jgi:hypothetical protein
MHFNVPINDAVEDFAKKEKVLNLLKIYKFKILK